MIDPVEQSMIRLLRQAKQTRDRARGWHTKTTAQRKATRLNGDTMTPQHPGTDINCRCYYHHNDPLFIKLTTDYPGDWNPYKQGYRVKWGKVTAYVYQTGSGDEEICIEMVCLKEEYQRKANSLVYLDDAFESCLDTIEYCLKSWHDNWTSKLIVFKDCPPKIRSFFSPVVVDYIESSQDTIKDLKNQLKDEQKTLRQLNKLKGVLGL